ncbi:uncharacterized protein LOC108674503 [Hyalella azteca]|uniref:Uncharacterized protein LOC108674503 n=1 Tax=Hyalella azteca TaxID=294128 RepID=A0A8B7NW53_HYAAZ|nr:uncharacterized protein LOC108674503 [Hyalella azteca]
MRCLAVSITQAASVSKCNFSSNASVLATLLITDSASITFISIKGISNRSVLAKLIEDVSGFCYLFSTSLANFNTSNSSCPVGSVLDFPSFATRTHGMLFSGVFCLASLASSFSAVQASAMTLFTDAKIERYTSYLEASSACVCRNRCFVDTRCLAVSITQAASVSKCYFSSSASVLTTLLITDSAFITFMKNKVCKPGFEEVGGFCYFFSSVTANFDKAKSSCPTGSVLAFPSSATQMNDLVDYIKKNKADVENWWVDATLRLSDMKFYWPDGIEIVSSEISNRQSDPYARLQRSEDYLPSDTNRDKPYNFICQYRK